MIKAGTTSHLELIYVTDDAGNPKTGLAYNTPGLSAYYVRNNGTATPITLAAVPPGNWISGGFVAVNNTNMPGIYQIGVPDAALAAGASSVVIQFKGVEDCVFTPLRIELYTELDVNTIKVSGVTQTARDLGANIDVAVSSRSTLSAIDVWNHAARSLTDKAGFSLSSTGLDAITNPASGSSLKVIQDTASAIKSKTDNLPAQPAAVGSAMALVANAIGAAQIESGALNGKGDWNTVAPNNAGINTIVGKLPAGMLAEHAEYDSSLSSLSDMLGLVSELLNADVVLDTSTTPWSEKYYQKGTTTLLLTKRLYDAEGNDITNIESYIGRKLT